MPDLSNHFKTLDITSDIYLIDWLLTLYTRQLKGNMDLISRIWDNFMLDGEIYAIRVALGLLKYRENQLINQPYNKIISFLRGGNMTPGGINFVDEDKLFKVIESIEIDHDEYYDDLKVQKWSY
jgi:Rab-GTPase-TBC domain